MIKKIKFKYKELKEINKVLVYVDYIDRNFFNSLYKEEWYYNNVKFSVSTYNYTSRGILNIDYDDNDRLHSFNFYIGTRENFFIIDKKEIKIFKDLENKVYGDKRKLLSKYFDKKEDEDKIYYHIDFNYKHLKFFIDYYTLRYDDTDKELFEIGNMFNSMEEAEKYRIDLECGNLTLEKFRKERQEFFKDYVFE